MHLFQYFIIYSMSNLTKLLGVKFVVYVLKKIDKLTLYFIYSIITYTHI